MAPGFGEDDAAAGKENGIPDVCPIDEECRFTSAVPDYAGIYVKDADKEIMRRLKEEGKLIHRGSISHNYPHCWRDESPLIYKAVSTWFVRIDRIKEKMLASNAQMSWVPEHIKDGRFGKWLENARDWAISRNRYWGCPLPIWRNKETGEIICIGSVEELEKLSGRKITDIHKHFVDDIEPSGAKTAPFSPVFPKSSTAGSKAVPCPMRRTIILSKTRNISKTISPPISSPKDRTRPAAGFIR